MKQLDDNQCGFGVVPDWALHVLVRGSIWKPSRQSHLWLPGRLMQI